MDYSSSIGFIGWLINEGFDSKVTSMGGSEKLSIIWFSWQFPVLYSTLYSIQLILHNRLQIFQNLVNYNSWLVIADSMTKMLQFHMN